MLYTQAKSLPPIFHVIHNQHIVHFSSSFQKKRKPSRNSIQLTSTKEERKNLHRRTQKGLKETMSKDPTRTPNLCWLKPDNHTPLSRRGGGSQQAEGYTSLPSFLGRSFTTERSDSQKMRSVTSRDRCTKIQETNR